LLSSQLLELFIQLNPRFIILLFFKENIYPSATEDVDREDPEPLFDPYSFALDAIELNTRKNINQGLKMQKIFSRSRLPPTPASTPE
jgi:hypothetical protein